MAEECKDEALSLLVVNKLRGLVDVCSVRAPFAGQRRRQFLQDIALATGATFVDSELGMMLQTVTPDMLGVAESATTTRCVPICLSVWGLRCRLPPRGGSGSP